MNRDRNQGVAADRETEVREDEEEEERDERIKVVDALAPLPDCTPPPFLAYSSCCDSSSSSSCRIMMFYCNKVFISNTNPVFTVKFIVSLDLTIYYSNI